MKQVGFAVPGRVEHLWDWRQQYCSRQKTGSLSPTVPSSSIGACRGGQLRATPHAVSDQALWHRIFGWTPGRSGRSLAPAVSIQQGVPLWGRLCSVWRCDRS